MEIEEWEKTQGSISYTQDGAPFFTVYLQAKWKVLWPGELDNILSPTMWSPEGASRETLLERIKDTREAVRKAEESAKTKVLLIKGLLAYSDFAQCCGPWANEKDWKQYHKDWNSRASMPQGPEPLWSQMGYPDRASYESERGDE